MVSSSPAVAAGTPRLSTASSSATVNGNTVSAKTVIKSSTRITAQAAGICVRNDAGKNLDFPKKQYPTISQSGFTFTSNQKLSAGTYTYFPCVQYRNNWWNGTVKTFTVKNTNSTPAPTNPPTSSPTPGTGSSATAMPTGNIPGWTQNYAQDFNTPAALGQVGNVYGQSLRGYDGFKDTSGNGLYAPDKVLTVSNGSLNYNMHSENGQPLVAAPTLNDYKGQKYGKYSVRFKTTSAPGYKIAFLLWPSSDNWNEGEIDWPEGNLDNGMMRPASAVPGTYQNGQMKFVPEKEAYAPTSSTDWHVATTEWTPASMKWYWDGQLVAQTANGIGVPQTDFRWTLQAETAIGAVAPAANVQGTIQVDWAVSYSYNPNQK